MPSSSHGGAAAYPGEDGEPEDPRSPNTALEDLLELSAPKDAGINASFEEHIRQPRGRDDGPSRFPTSHNAHGLQQEVAGAFTWGKPKPVPLKQFTRPGPLQPLPGHRMSYPNRLLKPQDKLPSTSNEENAIPSNSHNAQPNARPPVPLFSKAHGQSRRPLNLDQDEQGEGTKAKCGVPTPLEAPETSAPRAAPPFSDSKSTRMNSQRSPPSASGDSSYENHLQPEGQHASAHGGDDGTKPGVAGTDTFVAAPDALDPDCAPYPFSKPKKLSAPVPRPFPTSEDSSNRPLHQPKQTIQAENALSDLAPKPRSLTCNRENTDALVERTMVPNTVPYYQATSKDINGSPSPARGFGPGRKRAPRHHDSPPGVRRSLRRGADLEKSGRPPSVLRSNKGSRYQSGIIENNTRAARRNPSQTPTPRASPSRQSDTSSYLNAATRQWQGFQDSLKKAKHQIQRQKAEIARRDCKIAQQAAEMHRRNEEISRQEGEVLQLKTENESLIEQRRSLKRSFQQKGESIRQKLNAAMKEQQELREHSTRFCQRAIDEIRHEGQEICRSWAIAREEALEKVEERFGVSMQTIRSAKREVERAREGNNQQHVTIKALNEENERLKLTLTEVKEDLAQLRDMKSSIQGEIGARSSDILGKIEEQGVLVTEKLRKLDKGNEVKLDAITQELSALSEQSTVVKEGLSSVCGSDTMLGGVLTKKMATIQESYTLVEKSIDRLANDLQSHTVKLSEQGSQRTDGFTAALEAYKDSNMCLSSALGEIQGELDEAKAIMQERDQEIGLLQEDLALASKKLSEIPETVSQLKSIQEQTTSLQAELRDCQAREKEAGEKVIKLKENDAKLQNRLHQQAATVKRLENELQDSRHAAQESKKEWESTRVSLQTQLREAHDTLCEIDANIGRDAVTIGSLEQDAAASISDLTSKLEQSESRASSLQSGLASLRLHADNASREHIRIVSSLEQLVASREDELLNVKDELSTVKSQLSGLKDELVAEKDQTSTLRKTLSVTNEELAATTDELSVMRNKLSAAKDELSAARNDLSVSQDELSTVKLDSVAKKQKISKLVEVRKRNSSTIAILKGEKNAIEMRLLDEEHGEGALELYQQCFGVLRALKEWVFRSTTIKGIYAQLIGAQWSDEDGDEGAPYETVSHASKLLLAIYSYFRKNAMGQKSFIAKREREGNQALGEISGEAQALHLAELSQLLKPTELLEDSERKRVKLRSPLQAPEEKPPAAPTVEQEQNARRRRDSQRKPILKRSHQLSELGALPLSRPSGGPEAPPKKKKQRRRVPMSQGGLFNNGKSSSGMEAEETYVMKREEIMRAEEVKNDWQAETKAPGNASSKGSGSGTLLDDSPPGSPDARETRPTLDFSERSATNRRNNSQPSVPPSKRGSVADSLRNSASGKHCKIEPSSQQGQNIWELEEAAKTSAETTNDDHSTSQTSYLARRKAGVTNRLRRVAAESEQKSTYFSQTRNQSGTESQGQSVSQSRTGNQSRSQTRSQSRSQPQTEKREEQMPIS